jgi:hypothetical protein
MVNYIRNEVPRCLVHMVADLPRNHLGIARNQGMGIIIELHYGCHLQAAAPTVENTRLAAIPICTNPKCAAANAIFAFENSYIIQ